jgi:hypothetical protein
LFALYFSPQHNYPNTELQNLSQNILQNYYTAK